MLPEFCVTQNRKCLGDIFELLLMLSFLVFTCIRMLVRVVPHLVKHFQISHKIVHPPPPFCKLSSSPPTWHSCPPEKWDFCPGDRIIVFQWYKKKKRGTSNWYRPVASCSNLFCPHRPWLALLSSALPCNHLYADIFKNSDFHRMLDHHCEVPRNTRLPSLSQRSRDHLARHGTLLSYDNIHVLDMWPRCLI